MKQTTLYFQIVFFLSVIFSIQQVKGQVEYEFDQIYQTHRFSLKLSHNKSETDAPLITLYQTYLKTIDSNANSSVTVYDVLILNSKGFWPDRKAFIIIDDQSFVLELNTTEYEKSRLIDKDSESVMLSDSSSMTVYTGVSENNRKTARFSYELSADLIEIIQKANEIYFRYYTGPDLITIKMNSFKIKRLQRLLLSK